MRHILIQDMAVMKTLEHNLKVIMLDGVLQLANAGEPEIAYLGKARDIVEIIHFHRISIQNYKHRWLYHKTHQVQMLKQTVRSGYTANMAVIDKCCRQWYFKLPALVSSAYVFANFTYESYLCERDMGYNIDGILNDLRYGGNEQSRYNASTYWVGTVSVLTGDRQPELGS